MTLPVQFNAISLNAVNVELGLGATATIQMNQANVRTLAQVGASPAQITMNNLHGKSNALSASASPTSQIKDGFDFGDGAEIFADAITASATGGNGNYTYAWEHVSGAVFSNFGTTGATLSLYQTLFGFQDVTAVYRCSVNDTASNGPVLTNTVSVNFISEA